MEMTVLDKTQDSAGGSIQDRRLFTDVLFIREQSAIRADGPPAVQARYVQFDPGAGIGEAQRSVIARSARQPCFLYG
jgi:hypothetical protein